QIRRVDIVDLTPREFRICHIRSRVAVLVGAPVEISGATNGVTMDQFRLLPPQASTTSHEIDALFFALTLISLFFIAIIFLPILFFCVKYRRGSSADRSNSPSSSFLIESGWTIGPIFLSLGLFAWGAFLYFRIERRPTNVVEVQVVGKQWM